MTVDLVRPVRRRALRTARTGHAERRWPLTRVFRIGAAMALLVAALAVAVGGLTLWWLVEARSVNAVAGAAVRSGQQLSTALVDQETGVRGFGLTGRDEFLEPYRSGVEAQRAATSTLDQLGARGAALDAVERAGQEWRSGYADPVLARAPDAPGPDRGKALFDQLRLEAGALLADLEAQRAAASARADAATAFLVGVAITITGVLVAFLAVAGVVLQRSVLRPVSDLAGQVRQVVSGDVQRPVRADGPREIVELGEDVEAMRAHILRDLVDAQAVNQRLDDQAQELERSNRDLEQFAYVASHDLQEPLRKVSSFCQLLQRRYGGQLDDRADQYIEFAVDGAQRMQRLINDLLAFSRVGRTTEGFEPVDLDEVAAVAAKQLETVAAEGGGEIVLGELPVVPGDAGLLQQLLVNLLGNGLKFHRDGVPPVVRVDAVRIDDEWEVTVADNGIGIEPEYAEKVFVIFQRLHGRDLYPGTGIGLALAKKIVEFHGGRISLAPADGPGAVVRFTLPAVPEESSP